ncbi:MAG: hypothetical protein WCE21_00310 [Candidatus Babeliales bacterium]
MKHRFLAYILLSSGLAITSFRLQAQERMRELIILNDTHESPTSSNDLDAIAVQFWCAFAQKTAPIIASGEVVKNCFARKQLFDFLVSDEPITRESVQPFADYFPGYFNENVPLTVIEGERKTCKKVKNNEPITFQESKYIIGLLTDSLLNVNPNEWEISYMSDGYYVFVPKTYLDKTKQESTVPKPVDFQGDDDEWHLGLMYKPGAKKNNITGATYTFEDGKGILSDYHLIQESKNFKGQQEIYKTPPLVPLVQTVVINEKSIPQQSAQSERTNRELLPTWSVYVSGHGQKYSYIAGTDKEQFKQLLSFFNGQVNTNVLFYNSCYIGANLDIYKDLPPLNYIVIGGTVFADFTNSHGLFYGYNSNKPNEPILLSEKIDIHTRFDQFFPQIKEYFGFTQSESEKKEFAKIRSKKLNLEFQRAQGKSQTIGQTKAPNLVDIIGFVKITPTERQIAGVRLPGTEWFSPIDLPKNVFMLTKTKIQTAVVEEKPIVIKEPYTAILFNVSSDSLLSNKQYTYFVSINTSLVLDQPKIFTNTIVGDSVITIKDMKIVSQPLSKIFAGMLAAEETYRRSYVIQNLTVDTWWAEFELNTVLPIQFPDTKTISLSNVIVARNIQTPTHENRILIAFECKDKDGQSHYVYSLVDNKLSIERADINSMLQSAKVISKEQFEQSLAMYQLTEEDLALPRNQHITTDIKNVAISIAKKNRPVIKETGDLPKDVFLLTKTKIQMAATEDKPIVIKEPYTAIRFNIPSDSLLINKQNTYFLSINTSLVIDQPKRLINDIVGNSIITIKNMEISKPQPLSAIFAGMFAGMFAEQEETYQRAYVIQNLTIDKIDKSAMDELGNILRIDFSELEKLPEKLSLSNVIITRGTKNPVTQKTPVSITFGYNGDYIFAQGDLDKLLVDQESIGSMLKRAKPLSESRFKLGLKTYQLTEEDLALPHNQHITTNLEDVAISVAKKQREIPSAPTKTKLIMQQPNAPSEIKNPEPSTKHPQNPEIKPLPVESFEHVK